MAKVSGLGAAISVQDAAGSARIISNDFTNYQFATPRGVQDTTGIDKSAKEALLLLADFTVTLNGVVDFSANLEHDVFKTISSTSVNRAVAISPIGTGTGNPLLSCNCVLTDYQHTRTNTGEHTYQVPGQLADGTVPTWTVN